MSKKSQLIIILSSLLVIILAGLLLVLAKTGKLSLLADVIRPKTTTPDTGDVKITAVKDSSPVSAEISILRYKKSGSDWIKDTSFSSPPRVADANGQAVFTLEILTDVNLRYKAYATLPPNCQGYSDLFIVSASATIEKTIVLRQQDANIGGVMGIVTDATSGVPLNARSVTITYYTTGSQNRNTQTNSNGQYSFENIPAGSASVNVFGGSNYYDKTSSVTIAANTTKTLNFALERKTGGTGKKICVLVMDKTDRTKHISNVEVLLRNYNNGQIIDRKTTNAQAYQCPGSSRKFDAVFDDPIGAQFSLTANENFANSAYEMGARGQESPIFFQTDVITEEIYLQPKRANKIVFAAKLYDKNNPAQLVGGYNVILKNLDNGTSQSTTSASQLNWPSTGVKKANAFIETNLNNQLYEFFQVRYRYLRISGIDRWPPRADATWQIYEEANYWPDISAYVIYREVPIDLSSKQSTFNFKKQGAEQKIANATLNLEDTKCQFSGIWTTDANGQVIVSGSDFEAYKTKVDNRTCSPNLIVTGSAIGYRPAYFTLTSVPAQYTVYLQTGSSDNRFFGVTWEKDENGNVVKRVPGTQVYLEQTTAGETPIRLVSDNNSVYSTNDAKENKEYRVTAIQDGYTPVSYTTTFPGGAFRLDLYMKKIIVLPQTVRIPVLVFEKDTLEPLAGAEVAIFEGGNRQTDWKFTNAGGRADFFQEVRGQRIVVYVKYYTPNGTIAQQKTFTISEQAVANQITFKKQFLFVLDLGRNAGREEARLIVTVKDESNNRLRNAYVQIRTSFGDNSFFPPIMVAQTNANGQVNIPNDYYRIQGEWTQGFPPELISEITNKKVYVGDILEITAGHLQKGQKTIVHKIAKTNDSLEIILGTELYSQTQWIIQVIDPFNTNKSANDYLSQLQVFKVQGSQTTPINLNNIVKIAYEVNGISYLKLIGLISGRYYANLGDENSTSIIDIPASKTTETTITICRSSDSQLWAYSDNLYLLITDDNSVKTIANNNRGIFDTIVAQILKIKNKLYGRDEPIVVVLGTNHYSAKVLSLDSYASQRCFGINKNVRLFSVSADDIRWLNYKGVLYETRGLIAYQIAERIYDSYASGSGPQRLFRNRWSAIDTLLRRDNALANCVRSKIAKASSNSLLPSAANSDKDLFANFLASYSFSLELYYQIKYDDMSVHCRNVLKYLWQIFSESVFETNDGDNIVWGPGPSGKNTDITHACYNFEQIREGLWMRDVLRDSSIPLWKKAFAEFNRRIAPVFRNLSYSDLVAKIRGINTWIDNFFGSQELLTLRIQVVDEQGNPIRTRGIIVWTGPKFGITENSGLIHLSLPAGNYSINSVFSQTKNYQIIGPTSVKVEKDSQNRYDLKIK